MTTTLIAGCGYVGTELAKNLTEKGQKVYGLKRHPESLPSFISPIKADLTTTIELPDNVVFDRVIYALSAGQRTEDAYQNAYVKGLKNLIGTLEKQKSAIKHFIYVSSTAVYGQDNGEWVDETSQTNPQHFSGRILLEGEETIRHEKFPYSIIRFGGIYGPGRERLIKQVLSDHAILSEGSNIYSNRIHLFDCAASIAHLLERPGDDQIYIGVDHEPANLDDVYRYIAELFGKQLSRTTQQQQSRCRGGNKRCSNKKLLQTAYQFRFPTYREGYSDMIKNWQG